MQIAFPDRVDKVVQGKPVSGLPMHKGRHWLFRATMVGSMGGTPVCEARVERAAKGCMRKG